MKSRFAYIILAILLVIMVSPFIRHAGQIGHMLTTLMTVTIPVATLHALEPERNRSLSIITLAALFVIFDGLSMFAAHRVLMIAALGFATILYFYIIALLVKKLLSHRVITADLIYCAIATYLLIGVMWSGVYMVIEGISPGSFAGISDPSDLLYFSFVSLTTLGFGDILPQSIIAKRLTVLEAAMGGIYLAVIIAMLVGRYMTMEEEASLESDMGLKKDP